MMKRDESISRSIFRVCNVCIMVALMIICLYPFLYIIFASFSDAAELLKTTGLLLKPAGFSLEGYKAVLNNKDVYTGYANTIFYVGIGTTLNVVVTALLAYALSRKTVKYAKHMMVFIVITMFFSGGMIPTYLVVKNLGLLDNRWALIFPTLVSTYNLIVMKTAFMGIPDSLEESAKLDGANDIIILFRIVLPLSTSTIAVMVLFYGVSHWNSWFNAMMYLPTRRGLYPLQLILREILINASTDNMMMDSSSGARASLEDVIKYATVVVATVPILCVYPFLQKYFVKGVMVGAVKG